MASHDINMEQAEQGADEPVGIVANLLQNLSVEGPALSFYEKVLQDFHTEDDEFWISQALPIWNANASDPAWMRRALLDLRNVGLENTFLRNACHQHGLGSVPVDWAVRQQNNELSQYKVYLENEITHLRNELEKHTKDGNQDNGSSSKPEGSGNAPDQPDQSSKRGGTPLVQQFKDKNKIIRDQEEQFKKDCRKFGGDIAKLQTTVTTQKSTITDQQKEITNLDSTVANQQNEMTKLNSTVTEQQDEITKLNSTVAEQQERLTTMQNQGNAEFERLQNQANHEVATLQETISQQRDRIAALEVEAKNQDQLVRDQAKDQLNTVQQQAEDQLNAVKNQAEEQIGSLQNTIVEQRARLAQAEVEAKEADEQVTQLRQTVAEEQEGKKRALDEAAKLAQKAKEADEEVTQLRQTVAEAQDEKKKALDEVAKLHESVNEKDKEISQGKEEAKKTAETHAMLLNEHNTRTGITKLQDKISEHETQASITKQDLDKIKKDHERLEDRHKKSQDEIKGLRDDLLQEQKEAKLSASKYTSLKGQYDNLNEELETTETDKNKLSSELDETREAKNALVKELKDANLYIENAEKQMTSGSHQGPKPLVGSIVKKIGDLEKDLQKKSSEVRLVSDERDELFKELEEMKNSPYSAENYVTGLEAENRRLKDSNAELQQNVATFKTSNAELQENVATLEGQCADHIQESKNLVKSLDDSKVSEEHWKNTYDRKEKEAKRLRVRLEKSTGAVQDSYESDDGHGDGNADKDASKVEEGPATTRPETVVVDTIYQNAPMVPDRAASAPILGVELEGLADEGDFTPDEQLPVQSGISETPVAPAPTAARSKMSIVRKSAFVLVLLAILFLGFALIVSYYRKEKLLGRGDESARLAWNSYRAGGGTGTAWPSWLWDDELVTVPGGFYG